ncbi:hypothetical protein NQ317_019572 [Molorchus minor]|uniref:Uncharacterized protein n=1 Tax=Molorchus minor TaxID=1323400 RepID=A0ABQ9JZX0_9CUCU|nr:hypothetical protein NQ317_019572 [Molorchus minor]
MSMMSGSECKNIMPDFTDDESLESEESYEAREEIDESILEYSDEDSEDESYNKKGWVKEKNQYKAKSDTSITNYINPRKNSNNKKSARQPSNKDKSEFKVSSESSEHEELLCETSKGHNNDTSNQTSFRNQSPEIDSDSDDIEQIVKPNTKKQNIIYSDTESNSDAENLSHNIEAETSPDTRQPSAIDKISENLNNSRISSEFDFGRKGRIVNSTKSKPERPNPQPKDH